MPLCAQRWRRQPHEGAVVLGAAVGTWVLGRASRARPCLALRGANPAVDHASTEAVLTQQCADVCKLLYDTRINQHAQYLLPVASYPDLWFSLS